MKILLSGGGTAGHITPLLAVAEEIKRNDSSAVISVMGQKGDKNLDVVRQSSLISKIQTVRGGKFRRFHSLTLWQNITNFKVNLLNLRDAFWVFIGFWQALAKLILDRPDAIFFKGGFVVVPIGCAARILRIPYMTHDSDPIPGLANRLIAKGARKNAVVSEQVTIYPKEKTVVTGIPLAKEYRERHGVKQIEYKEKVGIPKHAQLLLIFTGTQGAKVIDDALESFMEQLLSEHQNLHVAYVFGRLNEKTMDVRYADLGPEQGDRLHRMTFISNAYDYIAAADIIIGRAGATSLAEFATIGRACIIIPAEQLTGGHQLKNVELYGEHCIDVVREATLPGGLEQALYTLLNSEKKRDELERAIRSMAPNNAAENIANEIIGIAGGHSETI